MKYFISFFCMALILIIFPSQTNKTTTRLPITDTTAIISKNDILNYNIWLRQVATYDQYTKLTPEQVTIELLNWKSRQLSDTTKKKK